MLCSKIRSVKIARTAPSHSTVCDDGNVLHLTSPMLFCRLRRRLEASTWNNGTFRFVFQKLPLQQWKQRCEAGDHLLHVDIKQQLCRILQGRKDVEGTRFLFFALALLSAFSIKKELCLVSSPQLEGVEDQDILRTSSGLTSEAAAGRTQGEGNSSSLPLRASAVAQIWGGGAMASPESVRVLPKLPDRAPLPDRCSGTLWPEWEA